MRQKKPSSKRPSSRDGFFTRNQMIQRKNQLSISNFRKNPYSLENEKKNFIKVMVSFIDGMYFENQNMQGRPSITMNNILKSLLIMSYHSWSYRRSMSDIKTLYETGLITHEPARATLNNHMCDPELKKILEKLIQFTALSFADIEHTLILDATSMSNMIRLSGSSYRTRKSRIFSLPPVDKTRKVHIAIAKESRIITCALTSAGRVHDSNFLKPLLEKTLELGYKINTLLADAAYNSKDHFILCEEHGIQAFLDFKSDHILARSKSTLRRNQFKMYHNDPELWHKSYDYRPLVEMVFSVIKRTGRNYLRSRQPNSQDCEMLLKILCYNLCILAKHYS